MDRVANYNIAFTGLKDGKHSFVYDINQEFFDLLEVETEFTDASISADISLDKRSSFMKFDTKIKGAVVLVCDISGSEYSQQLSGNTEVLVKFGDRYDDTDGEMIIIPYNQSEFNVARLIFEVVVLSVPMRRLSTELTDEDFRLIDNFHPNVDENYLDDFHRNSYDDIDPRWSELKKIK